MALRPQGKEPGLRAFDESREHRRRAIVLGKVRVREVATRFWLLTFLGFAVFGVGYCQFAEVQLDASKHEVLAQRRAVAVGLGESAQALHSELAESVSWLASASPTQLQGVLAVPDELVREVRQGPGIYLRIGLVDALSGDARRLSEASRESGHDGFSSCFFAGNSPRPQTGKKCRSKDDCGPGMFCGGRGSCVAPTQPYDFHWLGDSLAVLEEEWGGALEVASNEYKVRALELSLASVAKHEVPMAVEMVRRSKFFTVVMDEPKTPSEEHSKSNRAEQLRLRSSAHFTRVGIWRLSDKRLVAAIRVLADGRLVRAGSGAASGSDKQLSERVELAARRQSIGCALATDTRELLAGKTAGALDAAP